MDAVGALRIANGLGVDRHGALTRLQQRLDHIAFVARAAVVHPIHFGVLEHRVVVAGTTLPRCVERHDIATGVAPCNFRLTPSIDSMR